MLFLNLARADHESMFKVFGSERIRAHFEDNTSLKASVEATHAKQKSFAESKVAFAEATDKAFYLTCCEYSYSRDAKLYLSGHFAESDVHTAYSSASEKETCFVVFASAARVAEVHTPFLKKE